MNQQTTYQEQERLKRLNNEDCWDAVGVTFTEWQAQRPVRKPKPTQQATQSGAKE